MAATPMVIIGLYVTAGDPGGVRMDTSDWPENLNLNVELIALLSWELHVKMMAMMN